ncbi:MAG: polysaccharide biosynthesis protein [bacterium]|nr:polysaccharide biosynthesis protein [bacterium]
MNFFKNKIILVTGGTGSIGSEIVRQLLKCRPKQIRILSRNDSKQYHLLEKLNYPKNVRALIGDIRDAKRLDLAFENVNLVFHAAALKHVSLCEYNPLEAIKTNVFGSQNVIDAAFKNNVEKVIAISTDKAANPGNIMGLSKLMMEKLLTNTSYFSEGKAKLSCVRFGNVIWSEASVLPLWKKQAQNNNQINLTDKNATRFFMSIEQAVKLVLKAAELTQGGEVFILKMPSIKMADMADIFIDKHFPDKKIKIKLISKRIGDKTHEELFDFNDDQKLILENDKMFIIMSKGSLKTTNLYSLPQPKLSAYAGFKTTAKATYSSPDYLNNETIKKMI